MKLNSEILKNASKGFSLTEILVVVAIMGIIMALAIPNFLQVYEKSKADEGRQILNNIYLAQKRFYLDHNNVYASSLALLDVDFRPSANFGNPTASNDVAALGQVTRTGSYTLTVDHTGTISCSISSGDTSICPRMGF